MSRISSVRTQLFPAAELGYGGYLRLVQVGPQDPGRTAQAPLAPLSCGTNDLLRSHDQVHPEVVRGFGQVLVENLETMDGRGHGRPVADHPASLARANSRSE